MKKTVIVLTLITMTLSSFTINPKATIKRSSSTDQFAGSITAALQHASAKEYVNLFPTFADFEKMIKENSAIYGPYIEEAMDEFSQQYEHNLFHQVKYAFEELLIEGRRKGIDWNKVRLIEVNAEEVDNTLHTTPVTLLLKSNGQEFKIQIEKAFFIKGQWKVSQFIKFV
jgi:hypothetical protein